MVFVRPQLEYQRASQPTWQSILGAASDQDGREIATLAGTLRQIGQDWSAVLVVRLALLLVFLSIGAFSQTVRSLPLQVAFAAWIACDLTIISAHRFPRFDGIVPNKRLIIMAVLVFASAMTFRICAALALGTQATPLLITTLAPALLVLSVLGRLRALGLALATGACLGLLVILPDPRLAMPYLALFIGLIVLLGRDYWARARAAAADKAAQGVLSGEQAKALLEEFERSGRGWFWETDRSGNITYVSETLAAQLGHKTADLFGTPFLGDDRGVPARPITTISARSASTSRPAPPSRTWPVRAAIEAQERWWSISGRPVVTEFGQFLGFRGNGSDLTEMRRSQAEVARLASVDSLTGLANRPQMMLALEQAMTTPRGLVGECALLLLDLDRFKEVNDTMGHPAGDALLRQVAQRLLRLIGTKGKVGRIGGDEFKVVLPAWSR